MKAMDLNCDLGESFGAWKMGFDEEVMKYITSANVACGWHGGDPIVMDKTVLLAKQNNVSIGAHPGYPDLLGFGRRSIDCTYDELKNYIVYQVGALDGFCKVHGVKMTHVKPHGKMYLDAFEKVDQARAIAEAIISYNPDLFYVAFAGVKGELMTKENKVTAIDGTSIEIEAQTLCVHGDTPTAVDLVKTIREVLKKNGIDVIPM